MTTSGWEVHSSANTVLDTALNSLTSGSNKITTTAESNDATNELKFYGKFQLYLAAQGTARSAGAYVALYILPEIDDNYAFGGDSLDPPESCWRGNFLFDATTNARYSDVIETVLPNGNYHVLLMNETGQTLAATLNVLKCEKYSVATQ